MSTLRFGGSFELDLRAYELRRQGRALRLERIPMEVLRLLVEHRGELVTRKRIAEAIWGDHVFVDLDSSINGAIRKIRRALGDDPEHPRFLLTVTGKGYRFIAPVSDEPAVAVPAPRRSPAAGPGAPNALAPRVDRPRRSLSWRRPLLVAATVSLTALATYSFRPGPASSEGPPARRIMLAVLPFENLTGDPSQEYFSDGLTEEMISRLGGLDHRRLGVIARTSVMRYKQGGESLEKIGQELGADYVLEGSVRRDPQRIRITAQLIRVADQTHLWANNYDHELGNLIGIQEGIAHAVAEAVRISLSPVEAAAATQTPWLSIQTYEAYDHYLKGRYFWSKRTPQGLRQAISSFQRAIESDPDYARAYAGLADSFALLSAYSLAPPEQNMPQARAAALRALELDESLTEAHASLAIVMQNHDWDWTSAEREFRRSIELDPNYATAHHWYAEHLALRGRFNDSLAEIDRARRLDPLSLIIAADHAAILYFARQYDLAIERFEDVLEMEPNFPRAYMVIYAYVQRGDAAKALAALERWRQADDGPWIPALRAYVHGRTGDMEGARAALEELEARHRRQAFDPAPLFIAHIGMGDHKKALAWLEDAYARRSPALTALKVDPLYDPLRDEPTFRDLLLRLGLDPPS